MRVCQYLLKHIGIVTLKMRLRRLVQFVEELALVRTALQVSIKALKVRSDIKHGCFST